MIRDIDCLKIPRADVPNDDRVLMLRHVRWMRYGDALYTPGWRLEYRLPDPGFPHYLLARGDEPVRVQYIRAAYWLIEVQQKLVEFLFIMGFRVDNTYRGVARIPVSEEHNRLPHMFIYEGWATEKSDEAREDY